MNARNAIPQIETLTVYADASGAPATVRVADYVYACDTINGEARLTCIKPGAGSRTESKIAARRAEESYKLAVRERIADDWMAANRKMYS